TKLAVSCFLRLLDQGISVPCPPSKIPSEYLHNELTPDISKFTQTAPKKSSEQTLLRHPGSRIPLPLATSPHLLIGDSSVHVPDYLWHNKTSFYLFCFSGVLFYTSSSSSRGSPRGSKASRETQSLQGVLRHLLGLLPVPGAPPGGSVLEAYDTDARPTSTDSSQCGEAAAQL
ncbi:hypothetical protein ATANTOWER_002875, partial [Ataeniobius toweri]|nr:hypothetical protein [Ataeniobius toweri]